MNNILPARLAAFVECVTIRIVPLVLAKKSYEEMENRLAPIATELGIDSPIIATYSPHSTEKVTSERAVT